MAFLKKSFTVVFLKFPMFLLRKKLIISLFLSQDFYVNKSIINLNDIVGFLPSYKFVFTRKPIKDRSYL